MKPTASVPRSLAGAAILVLLASAAAAAEFERTVTLDADAVELHNLIGHIEVVPAEGGVFTAVVSVRGRDAAEGLIDVVVEKGRGGRIVVQFPTAEHRNYVYPELGSGRTTVMVDDDADGGWFTQMIRGLAGKRIEVRGKGKGLEVWADVRLSVPRDRSAIVQQRVGSIAAARIKGDLVLDTASGGIEVEQHEGDLVCDTGSGSVRVRGLIGSRLEVDTGSGSVAVERVETEYLSVDTGSGSVEATQVKAGGALIDTGSGSVTFELLRAGKGKYVVDTGSGAVDLVLPRDLSAELEVDTGSGGIDHDFGPQTLKVNERDHLEARLGGGAARIVVDTGSGGVKIKQR